MNTLSQTITKPKTITLKTKLVSQNQGYINKEGIFCIMTGEEQTEDTLSPENLDSFQISHSLDAKEKYKTQQQQQQNIVNNVENSQKIRVITWDEASNHLSPESFWVVIFEQVYDFTDLISANDTFFSSKQKLLILKNLKNPKYINNITILISTNPEFKNKLNEINQELNKRNSLVGVIESPSMKNKDKIDLLEAIASQTIITKKEVVKNKWFIINGFVYDLKETFVMHPKGDYFYKKYVGTDCTEAFIDHEHPESVQLTKCEFLIGKLADSHDEMDLSKLSQKSRQSTISNASQVWNGFKLQEEQKLQSNKQCSIF